MISRVKQGLRLAGISVTFRQDSPTSKLHQFFGGLNDRAQVDAIARYVVDGTDASILSTLQHPSWQDTWAKRTRYWPQRDEHQLFSDLSSWQIDQMRRFGEVLAALEPLRHDWGMFGTRASPDWLRHVVTIWLGAGRKAQPLTVLIDLVAGCDAPTSAALDIVLCRDGATYGTHNSVGRFAGVGAWLDAAHASIAVATPGLAANARTELASSIGRFGLQDRYRDLLLDLAIGSSKKARASARQALTAADTPPLVAALETRFDGASPGQRAELIEVAAAALGDQAVALLTRWGEGETAPKVLAALNAVRGAVEPLAAEGQATPADGPAGYTGVDGRWIDAGPIPPPPPVMPVPEEVLRILDPAVQAFNDLLAAGKAEATGRQWHWSRQFRSKGDRDLRALAALAEGSEAMTPASFGLVVDWLRWHEFKHPAITAFFDDPRLSLRHLTRIAVAMSNCHLQGLMNDWAGPIGMAVQRRLAAGVDFRTFYQLWTEAGGIDVIGEYLTHRWYGNLPDMGVALWPLLCTRFHELDQALGLQPQTGAVEVRTSPGLELLGHFPVLPARYRNRLMLLAGDSGSRIRDSARALLRGSPGIDAAIAEQLGDSRRDVRALAAEWLAARKAVDQAPLIRAALVSEKADLPRAAMITALDRLGEDVSAWFDRDLLKRDAEAALAKPLPKGLDWFPFDVLPSLHWADGAPVDPMLPRHWLVLSARLKQPGGNAMIDLWLDRLAPGDAHRLGWRVLTTWIDEDSRQPSEEEAHAHARLHVDAVLQANIANAQRWPESASYFPTDHDLVFAQLKRAKASEYLGSAVDSKGVLALATRVEGAAAAGRIRAFLKDHGARTSQAKALLDLLASIGGGAALQLLLSAANRSKQRSVQAHAAALVEAIAERRGWSPAQLADRTIPTGGFDPDGTQDVHLGDGRTYRLRLDDDAVVILNAEGREVKSLPGPRTDAEKPQADAARQQLATARKAVKQVFAAQIARLHEAMLLQRRWDVEEWDTFIAAHPIVGRIAARLIWQGLDEHGAVSATFRPLGDGSLTDAFDEPVSLAATAQVRLAHSTLLDPAEAAAWQQHLVDYGVAPAFDQLGRALPVLGYDDRDARSIEDRVGWMIETFALRGHATRLGYTRGAAEDGGWYHAYERPFREAGLVVEIAFSGSPLPEENRVAALGALTFRRARPGGGTGPVVLGDVPAVLLAECWRDLHDLADRGTGYDPDWQRKV